METISYNLRIGLDDLRVGSAPSIRACRTGELGLFLGTCFAAFGGAIAPDDVQRLEPAFELERLLLAFADDGAAIGTAGAVPFMLSIPGGELPCAGVTMVGVLPGHRRRGIFRALSEELLRECRARGEPLAVLWSSEGALYTRFGFGLASLAGRIDLSRRHAVLRGDPDPAARLHLVDEAEAARRFPPIYDAARAARPGMPSRSPGWWRGWRLGGPPGTFASGPPIFRMLLELDGEAAGYALYRVHGAWDTGASVARLEVIEALADSARATAALWRELFALDLVERITALHLAPDHPLLLLLRQPARMRLTLTDGLWLRVIDVEQALSARAYAHDCELVLEVDDPAMPWNHGRWHLQTSASSAAIERTPASPDIRLTAEDVGSMYLGGVSAAALAAAGRTHELRAGALATLDGALRSGLAPWCPDEF